MYKNALSNSLGGVMEIPKTDAKKIKTLTNPETLDKDKLSYGIKKIRKELGIDTKVTFTDDMRIFKRKPVIEKASRMLFHKSQFYSEMNCLSARLFSKIESKYELEEAIYKLKEGKRKELHIDFLVGVNHTAYMIERHCDIENSFIGMFKVGFFYLYDFLMEKFGADFGSLYGSLKEMCKAGVIALTRDNCYIYPQPIIHCNIFNEERHHLHRDDGPLVEFPGGKKLYVLEGVRMPSFLFEFPPEVIPINKVMKIKSAEVRLRAIKRIGIDNIYKKAKVNIIDSKGGYELIVFEDLFRNDAFCPFLKMVNPSTGEIHIEGVDNNCTSVDEANAWRLGLDLHQYSKNKPIILT